MPPDEPPVAVPPALEVTPTPEDTPPQITLEQALAELETARRQAAAREKRLAELETAETQRAQAQLSESERLKAQLAEATAAADAARAQARDTAIRSAVTLAATRAGFLDPADVLALADLSAATVDDSGTVTGIDEAIKALAKARPYLLKPATSNIGTPQRPDATRRQTPGGTPPEPPAPLIRF